MSYARHLNDQLDSANRQIANLKQELQEARAALSGRTVSCSQCNEVAQTIARLTADLQKEENRADSKHKLWVAELRKVTELEAQIQDMREAIKEAHKVLQSVPAEYDPRFFRAGKWTETALAKLKPFLP